MSLGVRLGFLALLVTSCSGAGFAGRSTSQGKIQSSNSEAEARAFDGGTGVLDSTPDGQVILPDPAAVAQLKEQCQKAAASLQSVSRVINYPERKDCSFGVAPNIERQQGVHTAREISPATLALPEGLICDVEIKSEENESLHYDDFLILTLAGQMIFASNRGIVSHFEPQQSIYTWNFDKLVGQDIGNFGDRPYCLGPAENCRLPGHDQEGPVSLNLASRDIAPITLALAGKDKVDMDLIATGDDNDEDCFHSKLDLSVTFKFITQ